MLALAFDTATDACTVAIGTEDKLYGEFTMYAPRAHMERLIPMVDYLLKQSDFSIGDIRGLTVGLGPGSFTGVRIGVATAKILAQALNLPLVGISTLDCLAYPFTFGEELVCVVLDAKRGEVYSAIYRCLGGKFDLITPYQVMPPRDLCSKLKEYKQRVILVGDALYPYGDLLKNSLGSSVDFAPPWLWFPKASNLIALAMDKLLGGEGKEIFQVVPIYVRLSEAEGKVGRAPTCRGRAGPPNGRAGREGKFFPWKPLKSPG